MLEIFAMQHMRMISDRRNLAEVLQMELRQSNKFMREYRNTKFIEYVDIVSRIIHKGQEMGLFRKDVMPGVAKRAMFGALDETARLWILSPDHQYTIEEAAQQISMIFLGGIEKKTQ
jgi:TetR/AcrR family fatty acid metabolism transcriptional regulator